MTDCYRCKGRISGYTIYYRLGDQTIPVCHPCYAHLKQLHEQDPPPANFDGPNKGKHRAGGGRRRPK